MTFDVALELILKHEGGYVNHPRDPGGETKYGISKRAFPDLDIKNLTVEQAGEIYHHHYWKPIRGYVLPYPIALCVFDTAVNSGVRRAARWLQKEVGVKADGIIGPMTCAAVQKAYDEDHSKLLANYMNRRLDFLKRLSTWDTFGKGWSRRVNETLNLAVENI